MPELERFRPYVAAYLVLIKDRPFDDAQGRQILLLKRANTGYMDGSYSLVSGHLNGGETTKECVIRESQEEAGIILKPEALEVVHVMHRRSPLREYFDYYLSAKDWSGEIVNKEPDKCAELKWFDLNSLPDNLVPEVKLALENIDKKLTYGEYGWD